MLKKAGVCRGDPPVYANKRRFHLQSEKCRILVHDVCYALCCFSSFITDEKIIITVIPDERRDRSSSMFLLYRYFRDCSISLQRDRKALCVCLMAVRNAFCGYLNMFASMAEKRLRRLLETRVMNSKFLCDADQDSGIRLTGNIDF